jgi:hypothetical protein
MLFFLALAVAALDTADMMSTTRGDFPKTPSKKRS